MIRNTHFIASAFVFALFLTLNSTTARAQLQPTHPNLTYATLGPAPLQLDIYLPQGASPPYPVVVWVHGGGWSGGDKFPAGNAGILTQHGFAVASINYRLTSQDGEYGLHPVTFPAQIHDVKGALRWLRANSATFQLNPQRFGIWGSSAGGHLAALAGTSGGVNLLEGNVGGNLDMPSHVQAAADYFGPTDLLNMQLDVTDPPGSTINHDAFNSPQSHLIGFDEPGQGVGVLRKNQNNPNPPFPMLINLITHANSITWVDDNDPHFFIAHGTADAVVPLHQSTRLDIALTDANVPHTYMQVPGAGHGNFPPPITFNTVRFFMNRLRHAPGDVNEDGFINVNDLLQVLDHWGPCQAAPNFCEAELTGDILVNVDDLLMVIQNWTS